MIRREKVKDIVEVRSFTHLYDFAADPGLTTASYHFTDLTSGLMGKWIDRICEIKSGRGAALALAGLRGVGKSHFIAVLGALASRAELRSRIGDVYIHSCLERLPKKSLSVARVRRGSGSSLVSELRTALAGALSINVNDLSDSLYDVLLRAFEISGDAPLLIFIDTDFGRQARVDRDDGAMLSEIAEAAKNMGIFVGIALDDDVAAADGPNSSIPRSYQIDFLDQEHLYKIVDRHIFPKHEAMLPVLKDIYSGFRADIPGFKWSEQRFLPLYPLHPATLEIAPLIRLFIQDFALLGFASEAGVKIIGRPADSLIGLDEMFGKVEPRLRKVKQLTSAFRDFDILDREIVQKSPVQFRLQAKLILKGLILLSLDGRGASAATIAATMMVHDEQDPQSGLEMVERLLDRFAMDFPAAVSRVHDDGSPARYRLRIGLNDDLDEAIGLLRPNVSRDDLRLALLYQLAERFPEIQNENNKSEWSSHVTAEWRGSMRRGEIIWHSSETENATRSVGSLDWTIRLTSPELISDDRKLPQGDCLFWEIAPLTPEEAETVTKYSVLKSGAELRQNFGDGASMTLRLLSASVDKICQRIFFDDAYIHSYDRRFPVECDLQSTHNLSQLITRALEPVFDSRYPSHPHFVLPLGFKEVTQLIASFFGRGDISNPNVQKLAQSVAEPLGLIDNSPEGYLPASAESINELPYVKRAFDGWSETETVYLSVLSENFKAPPFGLTREAQQLILASLVSQREIEFVTTTGNRINHRSLDLQIIWDDIVGVIRPVGEKYPIAKLLLWSKILTGNTKIDSLDGRENRIKIHESLQKWLFEWREGKILENYEELPDQSLNASSWRNAYTIRRSLSSVAEMIQSHTDGTVPLEECLGSIADLFLDSESEYRKKKSALQALSEFNDQTYRLESMNRYLSRTEITGIDEVEQARRLVLNLLESRSIGNQIDVGNLDSAWKNFLYSYTRCYQDLHQELFDSTDRQMVLRELSKSNEWQQFEVYSLLSVFDRRIKAKIEDLRRKYRDVSCKYDPIQHLDSFPSCVCGLKINDIRSIMGIPDEIASLIRTGVSKARLKVGNSSPFGLDLTTQDSILMSSVTITGFHR